MGKMEKDPLFWKCCEGYIKKEENRAVLLLIVKMKSGDYFFFK